MKRYVTIQHDYLILGVMMVEKSSVDCLMLELGYFVKAHESIQTITKLRRSNMKNLL